MDLVIHRVYELLLGIVLVELQEDQSQDERYCKLSILVHIELSQLFGQFTLSIKYQALSVRTLCGWLKVWAKCQS